MVDTTTDQDVPKRMMDILRMFLAASSAGEHCVFVLESKNKMISTKYRSVEVAPGTPVHSHGSGIPKKKNQGQEVQAQAGGVPKKEEGGQ